MKVIQQLIVHFEALGKISPQQLEQLVIRGFWGLNSPDELRSLSNQIGQSFYFNVTGEENGSLWGTDVYTSDSYLSKACVHAGLLEPGQAGIVKVTIVTPPPAYNGTTRHGITSSSYGAWNGAYKVELIRK